MTDFLPRTIVANAQGVGEVSVRGFGVEIIDGGAYGRENTLHLIRGEDGLSDGVTGADEVPCVAGVRMLGEFTGLRLVSPRVVPVRDRVKVRVLTQPGVRAVDSQPLGKPRVRFLSRGSANLAAGAYQLLWASATLGEYDRFSLEEQFDHPLRWFGWVAGNTAFRIYVFASKDTNPAGTWHVLTTQDAIENKLPVPQPHAGPHYSFDFTGPASGLNGESAPPWPYPPGSVELYAFNPSGVLDVDIDWMFGVTS